MSHEQQSPESNPTLWTGRATTGAASGRSRIGTPDAIDWSGDRPWLAGLPLAALDPAQANPARVYNYWIGGKDHFAADRVVGDAVAEVAPWVVDGARANRSFVARVVRYLARSGITQFLDLGTGLPAAGAVHEVAREIIPDARVVYVDHDPVVLAHARALLSRDQQVITVAADLRRPQAILEDVAVQSHLDLSRPLAVLFIAVLHFLTPEENPAGIVAGFRDVLVPGSYVAITHVADLDTGAQARRAVATREAARVYEEMAAPFSLRTPSQVHHLFDGLDLVEPGLVPVQRWRPDNLRRGGPPVPVLAGLGQRTV